jgi:hypothetical protein
MLSINHITQAAISLFIFFSIIPCCMAGIKDEDQQNEKVEPTEISTPTFQEASTQTDDISLTQPIDKMETPPWVKIKTPSTKKCELVSSAKRFRETCETFGIELTPEEEYYFLNKENCKAICQLVYVDFRERNQRHRDHKHAEALPKDQREFMKQMSIPNSATRNDLTVRTNNHFNNMKLAEETYEHLRGKWLQVLFALTHTAQKSQFSGKEMQYEILSESHTSFFHGPFSHLNNREVAEQLDRIHQNMGQAPKNDDHYQNTDKAQLAEVDISTSDLLDLIVQSCFTQSNKSGTNISVVSNECCQEIIRRVSIQADSYNASLKRVMTANTGRTKEISDGADHHPEKDTDYIQEEEMRQALKKSLEQQKKEEKSQGIENPDTQAEILYDIQLKRAIDASKKDPDQKQISQSNNNANPEFDARNLVGIEGATGFTPNPPPPPNQE